MQWIMCLVVVGSVSVSYASDQCYFEKVYKYYGVDPLFKTKGDKKEYMGCRRRVGSMTMFYTGKEVPLEECPKICESSAVKGQASSQASASKTSGH